MGEIFLYLAMKNRKLKPYLLWQLGLAPLCPPTIAKTILASYHKQAYWLGIFNSTDCIKNHFVNVQ